MAEYRVRLTTEIKASYVIEASSASAAINKIKYAKNAPSNTFSQEEHFTANEIEEEF